MRLIATRSMSAWSKTSVSAGRPRTGTQSMDWMPLPRTSARSSEPTSANLLYPEVGRLVLPPNVGAHTAFPLLRMDVAEFARDKEGGTRDFIAVVDESLVNECQEARQMLWIADITTESRPFGVASFTVPEASGDFCTRTRPVLVANSTALDESETCRLGTD